MRTDEKQLCVRISRKNESVGAYGKILDGPAFNRSSVPLLRSIYLVRVSPFGTGSAFFDFSQRTNARRTCSPSGVPSRCLTFLRPAARSGSNRKLCNRFTTNENYM